MLFKIVGALGRNGVPRWIDFFCSQECVGDRHDSEPLDFEDLQATWVTRRSEVRCMTCGKPIFPECHGECGAINSEGIERCLSPAGHPGKHRSPWGEF